MIEQCCGSGSVGSIWFWASSGSFYHQAKIVRKTLIHTVLWLLFDILSLKKDVNVPSKSNKQKNFFKINFVGVLKVNDNPDPSIGGIDRRIRIRTKMWLRTPPGCRAAGRPLLGGWPAGVHGPDRPSSPPPHATPAHEKFNFQSQLRHEYIAWLKYCSCMVQSALCVLYIRKGEGVKFFT
jgi:hypothetical protein